MIDTEKLRALLEAINDGRDWEENLSDQVLDALPALLDRLEKLEVVAEAAQNLQIHINHDDVGYDAFEAAVETMDEALSTLDEVAK